MVGGKARLREARIMQVDLSVLRPSSSIAVANSQFSRRLDIYPENYTRARTLNLCTWLAPLSLARKTRSQEIYHLGPGRSSWNSKNTTELMRCSFLLNCTQSVTCKIIGVIIHIMRSALENQYPSAACFFYSEGFFAVFNWSGQLFFANFFQCRVYRFSYLVYTDE